VPESCISFVPSASEHARAQNAVQAWHARVRSLADDISAAVAAEQRVMEQRLGRQLTQDEVNDTLRAGYIKVAPPHPLSGQARFARGE
jgi:hypothetical protein